MRSGGLELFVGCTRDPQWGPVIAVGLGGVWVEVLQDVALRPLPIDGAEVKRMLAELRGAKLLHGVRGMPAADLDAVADVIARIGDAAVALGADLEALEVNPLWVRGCRGRGAGCAGGVAGSVIRVMGFAALNPSYVHASATHRTL